MGLINKERIKNAIKRAVSKSKICNIIYSKNYFPNSKFRYLLDDVIYVREKFKKNYVSEQEIEDIMEKINNVLDGKG